MLLLKNYSFFIFLFVSFQFSYAQNYSWFYIRTKSSKTSLKFQEKNNILTYVGNDQKLKNILNKYTIYEFKKTFKHAKKENLKKTYFVVTTNKNLLPDLLKNARHLFEFGELINEADKKIFEPNDYGLSSTIGDNLGLSVDMSYLDFLEVPKAWYYTTGSKRTKIGISDASVDTTNTDFKNKTTVMMHSPFSKGHGSGVSSIAAAQGDNAYGVPGICYDCSIYTTRYGNYEKLEYLLELANRGVRVVNCSWSASKYYQTAQDVINEMFEKGTLVVAAAGNLNWTQTNKGTKLSYPASYNHVISVSAGMYRNQKLTDNILKESNGNPYAENIKGYVGRTIGFKDNKIGGEHYIYPVSVTSLNKEVDILAPSTGVLSFAKYIRDNTIAYDENEHTSNATPLVTGTIGLMFSLNPCLPANEVESILKLTSYNIDHIKANRPYKDHYGSGLLNTGNAVELLYKLYTDSESAILENQSFTRWDFNIRSFSKQLVLKNLTFKDDATLNITAKNNVIIKQNTVLKPSKKGEILLKIESSLKKECDLVLREGFPNNKYYFPNKKPPTSTNTLSPKSSLKSN